MSIIVILLGWIINLYIQDDQPTVTSEPTRSATVQASKINCQYYLDKEFSVSIPNQLQTLYVQNVHDGDTITAIDPNDLNASKPKRIKIRLNHIDAPELKQNRGKDATQYLKKKINQKTIEFSQESTDRYGRQLGTIYFEDKNINLEMVRQGYAWVYQDYTPESKYPSYYQAQCEAKNESKGIWGDKSPIHPKDFRRNKR
ncbi:thermonuclease family protein [Basilea psittacipulmonis]|uniref:thermonuclease family protein n=1 Tax=Basilea psittacipulmonis TaxID=1472345 RepID=UPI001300E9D3|nr:thermonuclease family protein [Basilea psittacipulmonis]